MLWEIGDRSRGVRFRGMQETVVAFQADIPLWPVQLVTYWGGRTYSCLHGGSGGSLTTTRPDEHGGWISVAIGAISDGQFIFPTLPSGSQFFFTSPLYLNPSPFRPIFIFRISIVSLVLRESLGSKASTS